MVGQSTIFPIFVRAEYQQGQAFQRWQSDAQRAANAAKAEFQGVADTIDQALARQRTASGSLDLGLDDLRLAADAQKARAIAADEVANATARLAREEAQSGRSISVSAAAARSYAKDQDRLSRELMEQVRVQELVQKELSETASATDLVTRAGQRGTNSRGNVINSVRAERTAFVQLGQQITDVGVQIDTGTRASTIFAQQVPQMAFALSGLSNSTNKAKAAVGSFATFLAGPWGSIMFLAAAVTGPYITALFETEDAADKAKEANESLAEKLDFVAKGFDAAIEAAQEYNIETDRAAQTALQTAQNSSLAANALLKEARARRENLAAQLEDQLNSERQNIVGTTPGSTARAEADRNRQPRIAQLEALIVENQAAIDTAGTKLADANFSLAGEQALIQGDEAKAIAEGFANAREELRGTTTDTAVLREELLKLNAQEKAALDTLKESRRKAKSPRDTSDRELRRAQRLAEFAEDAASKIAGLRDRFTEIPPEVAKINTATRTLDDLISDLGVKKPIGFQSLIDQAKELRDNLQDFGIEDALDVELDKLREQFDQRLNIQRLTLAGRDAEVAALSILARLQKQYGEAAKLTADEVRDIVDSYEAQQEALARLQEQQDAFLDATRSLRGELESLFSGEGFDLREIGKRLQARLQVEAIFGDALRDIEGAVKTSFDQSVDRAEQGFEDVAREAVDTAQAFATARGIISGAPTGGALSAGSANDNSIIVTGTAKAIEESNTVTGMTPEAYADLMAKRLTEPLLEGLPPGIAQTLSPVLSGVLSGIFLGGTAGGVVGGLKGLFGTDGSLEGALGIDAGIFDDAFSGLQTGAQTNAILDALGIGSSATGAAIGGALGSILGPIGSIAGSIIGGLLGNLIAGTPRGSTSIGGVGGELGITGTRGSSTSREESSIDLAGSVIDTIDRIAGQLDADVNAALGSVSIGVRDDNIRVDTTGQGITKTSNGAIDFGSDAEAAIQAAVLDLIQDGVIGGLSAAEQRLIQQGKDLETALTDVLTFRSVFDRLEQNLNPLRAEILALNNEFEDLIDLFERAGASSQEFAQLEELYQIERAKLIEDATDRVVGSLRDLINDLTTGDNGLSLRDRRANAAAEFDTLRTRVEGGDASAIDDFAEASRVLLDIERQLFGSQQGYFDRFNEVLAISNSVLAEQEALTQAAIDVGSPFGTSAANDNTTPIVDSIASQTGSLIEELRDIGAKIDASNENLGVIGDNTDTTSGGFRSPDPDGSLQVSSFF